MNMKEIKENKLKMILGFSIPSIIAMLLQTVITITDGYFTGNYVGENALAAINLGLPILYFYLGAGLCIGVGGSVICGRLFGAKETESAIDIRKITNRILFVIGVIVAGKKYAGMFGCSNSVADMVAFGFRLYAVTFFVMGYNVINSMYFTSCGDAKSSAIISSLRGIILLLAFTLILPAIFGMNGVWLTAPCSEFLTAIVAASLIGAQQSKIKRGKLNERERGQYNTESCYQ